MSGLIDLFETAEINAINNHFDAAQRRHPAWTIMNAHDLRCDYKRKPKDYLTNQSVDLILSEENGEHWLKGVRKRVAQTTDFEESVSALAEIRCYGALLEAGFSMRPIPTTSTPTADFEFTIGGETGIVEVAAKLEHDEQTRRAREIAAGNTPEGVERSSFEAKDARVDFVVSEKHPFGAPDPQKAGDTTQTNAISRICSIKRTETQIAPGKAGLLWLDFRDLGGWPEVLKVHDTAPLISGHGGGLTSGAFWYAFYGWKSAPVFEEDLSRRQIITPMGHFGRFHPDGPKSLYSAAVICLAESTVVFENPSCPVPISNTTRRGLTRLPWFDINHTVADWQGGDLARATELSRSMIQALCADRGQRG